MVYVNSIDEHHSRWASGLSHGYLSGIVFQTIPDISLSFSSSGVELDCERSDDSSPWLGSRRVSMLSSWASAGTVSPGRTTMTLPLTTKT